MYILHTKATKTPLAREVKRNSLLALLKKHAECRETEVVETSKEVKMAVGAAPTPQSLMKTAMLQPKGRTDEGDDAPVCLSCDVGSPAPISWGLN